MPSTHKADLEIILASLPEHIEEARTLFLEYAKSLDFSLCFQQFDEELKGLPGAYSPPSGRLLLAQSSRNFAGCVALRALGPRICEMKRLYVRPTFRGLGLGKELIDRLILEARTIGYSHMRLDTIGSSMKDAVELYRRIGFQEIAPYRENPIAGALYMELRL